MATTIEVFHKSTQRLITIQCMIGTAIDTLRVSHDFFLKQCESQDIIVSNNERLDSQFSVNSTMVRLLVGSLGVEAINPHWYNGGWKIDEREAEQWFDSIVKKEFLGVAQENFA
jgi:hypothetical protein